MNRLLLVSKLLMFGMLVWFSALTLPLKAQDAQPPPPAVTNPDDELMKRIKELEKRMKEMEKDFEEQTPALVPPVIPDDNGAGDIDDLQKQMFDLLDRLREHSGKNLPLAEPAGAYLGIEFRDLSTKEAGALGLKWGEGIVVKDVVPESPAAKADVKPGDVIVEIAGAKVRASWELVNAVRSSNPGDELKLTILRDGKKLEITVTLGAPEDMPKSFRMKPRALPQLPPFNPGGGFFAMPGGNVQTPEDVPAVEVRVQNEGSEATLTIRSNALALTDELRALLKPSEKEEQAVEQALAEARNEVAQKLTPVVTSAMEGRGGIIFDNAALQTVLDETLKNLEKKIKAALPDDKFKTWQNYAETHKYMSQSFSVTRNMGKAVQPPAGPTGPAVAPPPNVMTF